MKKLFKFLFITIAVLLVLIVGAALIIPVVFKDDIEAEIKTQSSEMLHAELFFDADDFGLTMFSHFPSLSVEMHDFGVIGIGEFKNDTLVSVNSFEVAINVMSLFGDKMEIDGIYLTKPNIKVIVTEEGLANYDIAKPSTDTTEVVEEEVEEESTFAMTINEWQIIDGDIVYDDRQGAMYAEVFGLNHSGTGDMTLSVFDLGLKTAIEKLSYKMDGVAYVSEGKFDADMKMNIDLDKMKFTFQENTFKLNEFGFAFDGFVGLPEDADLELDITMSTPDTDFKNILSLVPGVFMEGFEELKTSGSLVFDGEVKGKMVGDQLPSYALNLVVKDGMFQYPDLPTAVNNVNVDLHVLNEEGLLEKNVIDLKSFHMDMGSNPVDMKLWAKGLDEIDLKADLNAKVDLGSLAQIYPIEGLDMKGLYTLAAKAEGVLNDSLEKYPIVEAAMGLKNGYVKSSEVPAPIENIQLASVIHVPADYTKAHVGVDEFMLDLDGETFAANGTFNDLDNPTYDVSMNGTLDFEKLLKIYPLEDMTLKGRMIIHDFSTKGDMATIDAEEYQKLPTSGSLSIENLFYSDADLPQGFKINAAEGAFNPDKMELKSFDGAFGVSDMKMDGVFSNYMGYLFSETDTVLKGNLNFASNLMDLNDMMGEEATESAEAAEVDTTSDLEVVEVPKNIDFVLHTSAIDKVLYDNYVIENLKGDILVKDGVVSMDAVRFNMLGGSFETNGKYDAQDLKDPKFYWDIDIKGLGIQNTYETFNTVKALAPVAKNMEGAFDGKLKIFGGLKQDMMPKMSSLRGEGLFKLFDAALKGVKTMDKVGELTGFNGFDDVKISDNTEIAFSILEGVVNLKPFKAQAGDSELEMGGTNSYDGTMDYKLGVDVPSAALGQATNAISNSLGLGNQSTGDNVHLDVGLVGAYDQLKPKLLGTSTSGGTSLKESANASVQTAVDDKKEEATKEVQKEANKQVDKATEEVQKEVKKQTQEATKNVDDGVKKEANKQLDKIKGGLKGFGK